MGRLVTRRGEREVLAAVRSGRAGGERALLTHRRVDEALRRGGDGGEEAGQRGRRLRAARQRRRTEATSYTCAPACAERMAAQGDTQRAGSLKGREGLRAARERACASCRSKLAALLATLSARLVSTSLRLQARTRVARTHTHTNRSCRVIVNRRIATFAVRPPRPDPSSTPAASVAQVATGGSPPSLQP